MLFVCLFIRQKQKRGIRILASRRRSVRLGSDSLAAARSHSGSDSRLRLSFIARVPLRYAAGASFTTEPVRIRLSKGKGGFEFSRLDDARSRSALTCQRARHSLPSPFESPVPQGKERFQRSFPFGLPWGIRTPNRQNRNLILYPIALRADIKSLAGFSHFLKDL